MYESLYFILKPVPPSVPEITMDEAGVVVHLVGCVFTGVHLRLPV